MNACDVLSTKDNGDDLGTNAFPEMGLKETKSTEGTVCTSPVNGEESVITYVIGNLIMSLDQASPEKNSEWDTEGWTEVIPAKSIFGQK